VDYGKLLFHERYIDCSG